MVKLTAKSNGLMVVLPPQVLKVQFQTSPDWLKHSQLNFKFKISSNERIWNVAGGVEVESSSDRTAVVRQRKRLGTIVEKETF